jgi:hypothetical protein
MAASFQHGRGRCGQSLIEACMVIALICLIFLGVFQVSQLAAAREILNHAAARGARARTVGFNSWMVEKSIRVAAIPNAGRVLEPDYVNRNLALQGQVRTMRPGAMWSAILASTPASELSIIERSRIPLYMGSENQWQAQGLLDYDDWSSVNAWQTSQGGGQNSIVSSQVWQDYRLWVPMHRAFYDDDVARLRGQSYIEEHFRLYLEDMGW